MLSMSTLRRLAVLGGIAVQAASLVLAAPAAQAMSVRQAAACTLPTTSYHTPAPSLHAKLARDRAITFYGRTCSGDLMAVFNWAGNVHRTTPESLVCTAKPDASGHYSCTTTRKFPRGNLFGVVISGVNEVSLSWPGKTVVHLCCLPHGRCFSRAWTLSRGWSVSHGLCLVHRHWAPQTGFGGLARVVARHHVPGSSGR
jgi:hypothetical protein